MPGLEVVPGALVELGACEPGRAELRVLPCACAVVPRASGFVQMPGGILTPETQPWWCCGGTPLGLGSPNAFWRAAAGTRGWGVVEKGEGSLGTSPNFC